ncbi:MAG: hypothetical protein ABI901_04475 [Roseiflexaceae bacterium]
MAVAPRYSLISAIDMYFFCHYPDERRSPALCREFPRRLERLADVPPLPRDALDAGMEQATIPALAITPGLFLPDFMDNELSIRPRNDNHQRLFPTP